MSLTIFYCDGTRGSRGWGLLRVRVRGTGCRGNSQPPASKLEGAFRPAVAFTPKPHSHLPPPWAAPSQWLITTGDESQAGPFLPQSLLEDNPAAWPQLPVSHTAV